MSSLVSELQSPDDWTEARLDHVTHMQRNTVAPKSLADDLVQYYSIPALEETGEAAMTPPSEIESGKIQLIGDEVLISKLNPRKARVVEVQAHPTLRILCSGEFVALRPKQGIDKRFLFWLLTSEKTRQDLNGAVQSVTRSHQRVRPEEVTKMRVNLPSVDKQRAIADFLDHETARIDALIANKQKMSLLLDERRRETISLGVRGLLEPGYTTHGAGISWAPTVRAPWRGVMIKHFAAIGTGHTPSRSRPELWEAADIPWITTGEIKQVRDDRQEVIVDTRECVSELGIASSAAELHPAGTVVLCRTASAGYSAIMGKDMATSQDFVTWTCSDRLLPRYLLMCLRAMRKDLLGRLAYGSTHQTIYWPDVESLKIPLPSVQEQTEVLRQIDQKLRPIDSAHQILAQQIETLQEHRQALITAAVTGQLDISSAA